MVVGCSIVETELSSSVKSNHSDAEQKTIHLHLKKFFSGTRFSSQYFLNCMSAKHKEGDLVYVSGKVGELKYCYLLHATYSHFLVVLPNHEACLQMVFFVGPCNQGPGKQPGHLPLPLLSSKVALLHTYTLLSALCAG